MPPSMLPDSPDGPQSDGIPKSPRASRSPSRTKVAPIEAKQGAATAPVSAPALSSEATTPSDDPASARKATAVRVRKAHEQRLKVSKRASSLLKFVSDPTRLQVLMILTEGEHHVGALCEQLGQSQPAVSHHLALLRHGGVIVPRRAGKNNFYTLSDSGRNLAAIARLLLQHN